MRVVVNGRFLTRGMTGVERFAMEALRAIDALLDAGDEVASRFTFVLAVPATGARDAGLRHFAVQAVGRLSGHAWEQLELPRAARGAILLSLANASPIVVRRQLAVIHDAAVFAAPGGYSPAFRAWYRLMLRAMGRRARAIATVSAFSKAELARHRVAAEGRIHVVHPGVDHIEAIGADPSILDRHRLRGCRYVLAVGSLAPNKNLAGLLEAVARLGPRDFEVVVAGGANPRVFGRRAGAGEVEGGVRHLGVVSDGELRALYEHAACFVFPSLYEGFGLPPVEAMALGCPTIVSRIPALEEACGDAALACDARNPNDIAAQILRVVRDETLAGDLRARGQVRARAYRWRTCASRILHLLGTLAELKEGQGCHAREASHGTASRADRRPSPPCRLGAPAALQRLAVPPELAG